MWVSSKLVPGARQLLLGEVAIPPLVLDPSASDREGWEVAPGAWATAVVKRGLTCRLDASLSGFPGGYQDLIWGCSSHRVWVGL